MDLETAKRLIGGGADWETKSTNSGQQYLVAIDESFFCELIADRGRLKSLTFLYRRRRGKILNIITVFTGNPTKTQEFFNNADTSFTEHPNNAYRDVVGQNIELHAVQFILNKRSGEQLTIKILGREQKFSSDAFNPH